MSKAKFLPLAAFFQDPSYSGDASPYPALPTWQSFATWAGEFEETNTERGVNIRVSPSWYTPRWSRLDAIAIEPAPSTAPSPAHGRSDAPRSRWAALRRTNHLVASVSR